jgi:hypothetical protein
MTGELLGRIHANGCYFHPVGMCVFEHKVLLACDDCIYVLTQTGDIVCRMDVPWAKRGCLGSAPRVCFHAGEVYITDTNLNCVEVFDPFLGRVVRTISTDTDGRARSNLLGEFTPTSAIVCRGQLFVCTFDDKLLVFV